MIRALQPILDDDFVALVVLAINIDAVQPFLPLDPIDRNVEPQHRIEVLDVVCELESEIRIFSQPSRASIDSFRSVDQGNARAPFRYLRSNQLCSRFHLLRAARQRERMDFRKVPSLPAVS